MPGFRYWPRFTSRIPSRPENGARTVLRLICAWSAVASAVTPLRPDSSVSSCDWAMVFDATSARDRLSEMPARSSRARVEASWARSTPLSSSTSTSPSWTICPDSKWIRDTTPAASLLTATPRTATMLPTAESVPSQDCAWASEVLTTSGGGPDFSNCLPKAMSDPICLPLIPTSVPTSSTRPRTATT